MIPVDDVAGQIASEMVDGLSEQPEPSAQPEPVVEETPLGIQEETQEENQNGEVTSLDTSFLNEPAAAEPADATQTAYTIEELSTGDISKLQIDRMPSGVKEYVTKAVAGINATTAKLEASQAKADSMIRAANEKFQQAASLSKQAAQPVENLQADRQVELDTAMEEGGEFAVTQLKKIHQLQDSARSVEQNNKAILQTQADASNKGWADQAVGLADSQEIPESQRTIFYDHLEGERLYAARQKINFDPIGVAKGFGRAFLPSKEGIQSYLKNPANRPASLLIVKEFLKANQSTSNSIAGRGAAATGTEPPKPAFTTKGKTEDQMIDEWMTDM
jgi:hypothetical protein